MGKITKEEIKKLADLARISLDDAELESFRNDIDSIISYIKQIQEVSGKVDEENVSSGVFSLIKNKLREDENPHEGGKFSEDILKEAPQRQGNYFQVKKIL